MIKCRVDPTKWYKYFATFIIDRLPVIIYMIFWPGVALFAVSCNYYTRRLVIACRRTKCLYLGTESYNVRFDKTVGI